jgi:hypothetical protein
MRLAFRRVTRNRAVALADVGLDSAICIRRWPVGSRENVSINHHSARNECIARLRADSGLALFRQGCQ